MHLTILYCRHIRSNAHYYALAWVEQIIFAWMERLGYVRNPRSLMEGTETLCRDDIGDLPGSPEHL